MKKIVFGLIACGAGVVATSAVAEPSFRTVPPVQSMIQRTQHFGWPDRPSGPGGPPYYGVNSCDAVQEMCANQWQVGGPYFNRCMALRGC